MGKNSKPTDQHNQAVNRLIETANDMKDKGFDPRVVSAALISAAGIYATYVEAGNEGYLQPTGVDRLTEIFRQQVSYIQDVKKEELRQAGHDVDKPSPKQRAADNDG
jgi:hypothetical protein